MDNVVGKKIDLKGNLYVPIDVPEYGHVDMELVAEVIAWLRANPTHWNQNYFATECTTECKTAFCFAGTALMLRGRLTMVKYFDNDEVYPLDNSGYTSQEPMSRIAQELLGLTEEVAEIIFFTAPLPRDHDIDVFEEFVYRCINQPNERVFYEDMLQAARERTVGHRSGAPLRCPARPLSATLAAQFN